ncbi:MAG: acyl-CoA dehydrogenase family protein, partial [Aeromicrobium sp.]
METTERRALADAVRKFAEAELEPHAIEWDEQRHFPVDVLRRAGDLVLGGICIGDDIGGSDLG